MNLSLLQNSILSFLYTLVVALSERIALIGMSQEKLSKSEYPDNIYSIDQSYENKEEFMKMYEGPVINYFIKGLTKFID